MKTEVVQIVDRGRGPQLSTSRITVMDVFYYLHRGYDFEFIHDVMPSLTREEFEAIIDYVANHQDELAEKDHRVEEFHKRGMEAQQAKGGIFAATEENLTTEERVARLKQKLERKIEGRNGAHHSD